MTPRGHIQVEQCLQIFITKYFLSFHHDNLYQQNDQNLLLIIILEHIT